MSGRPRLPRGSLLPAQSPRRPLTPHCRHEVSFDRAPTVDRFLEEADRQPRKTGRTWTGGEEAEIKLETFTFTRYGSVKAKVKTVTADAVNDEKRGAIFPVILSLDKTTIDVDGSRSD